MLVAEANVQTERSTQYLVQLCSHLNKMSRANPSMKARVEWSDDRGVISLDWGRCMLGALPGVLTLRAEAPDPGSLELLRHRVADLLEGIGRREHLTVVWATPEGLEEPSSFPGHEPRGGEAHG